ncbi:hypothetical protein BB559_001143 [Furculomyces boomerangus]|uniref:Velvet domain-containing protein n=2 Tax=Harpellales TaxID=61421 RepID=A0A2T9Z2Z4_9FUNG|nr:hypothetical protein BB559_001143 [Furculomyces boomerangus]PVZ98391.1 hypothetical protein BB558_005618 [Smittium angustum]PVZ99651.1 hypothetical protein BB558_004294 [Smittium angustum]
MTFISPIESCEDPNYRYKLEFDYCPENIPFKSSIDLISCFLTTMDADGNLIPYSNLNPYELVAYISLVSSDGFLDSIPPGSTPDNIISGNLTSNGRPFDEKIIFTFKNLIFNVRGRYKLKITVFDLSVMLSHQQRTSSLNISSVVSDTVEIQ